MSINIGNNEREAWWVINNTSTTIIIGDLKDVPSILAGNRLNLLAHTTKNEIAKSKVLASLIKTRKLSLNKTTSFTRTNTNVPGNISVTDADMSITPAEENETGAILYRGATDQALIRVDTSTNALEETGITICDNNCFHNVNSINFAIPYTEEVHTAGKVHWNEDDGTLEADLLGGNVCLQIGQENVVYVRNDNAYDIDNGKVVYINGAQGNSERPTIDLADSSDPDKIHIAGLTTEDIAAGALGYITTQGKVRGVDTSDFTAGDKLYLSTNGDVQNTHPSSSTEAVAIVGRAVNSKLDGTIEVLQPQMFSIGNDFDGILRQSVHNKSTGTSAGAGFTAVNDLNHFTTIGIANSNNTTFPNEVSIHYAPGYGDHWMAIDGAKDFVWFTDPEDRHTNSSLEYERMRLTSDGELCFGGYRDVCLFLNDDVLTINPGQNPSGGGSSDYIEVLGDVVYRRRYATPDEININIGSTASSLSDLEVFGDGNIYRVNELTSTGQQFDFFFYNVTAFSHILIRALYSGSVNTHEMDVELYNHVRDAYDTVRTLTKGAIENDLTVSYFAVPYVSLSYYIDNSNPSLGGVVKIRFNHVGGGINTHYTDIDFIGLEI